MSRSKNPPVQPGTQHAGSPPGYTDATGAARMLGLARKTLYDVGYLDILDSWQNGPRTPRLFRRDDVVLLENWLWARRGMIALGWLRPSEPMLPERGMGAIRAWLSEGEYLWDCPVCGGRAIGDLSVEDGPLWCEEHGVVNPADYPPTESDQALEALYEEDWSPNDDLPH